MAEILIQSPDKASVMAEYEGVLEGAVSLVITTKTGHGVVLEQIKEVGRAIKLVKAKFAEPKAKTHSGWKSVVALEKECLEPLIERKGSLNATCDVWETEQQAIIDKEKRRIADELKQRDLDDQRAKTKQENIEREQLKKAEEAEAVGDTQAADAAIEAIPDPVAPPPPPPPPPPVRAQTADVEGVHYRTTWSAKVTDFGALICYVSMNLDRSPELMRYLAEVKQELDKDARNFHEKLNVPGVEAVATKTRITRG